MNAAEYIAHSLSKRGVTHVFELVGGMITFLLDALGRQGDVQVVSMHHEQACGFAAEGYGRVAGVPGVAMATSGPGATNLLTAIGSCYFDSTPAVFITGQVNTHEQKGDRRIRQLGFQETDIVSMAKPITKASWLVNSIKDLPRILDEAFTQACLDRPGPVLIDIPMDVQRAEIENDSLAGQVTIADSHDEPEILAYWQRLYDALSTAEKPLILVGGGIRSSCATEQFRSFAKQLGVPVVNSLMAVDVLAAADENRVGLIGSYGNRWANVAIAESDLLLVLGSRLDIRQTGADTTSFRGDRRIFHVDCSDGEVNNRVLGCEPLITTIGRFLRTINGRPLPMLRLQTWRDRISDLRIRWPDTRECLEPSGINPNEFMRSLSVASTRATAFVVDVGQHQMWAAQSIQLAADQRFLTSGGMGAMGFALPAAIGACCGANGRPVVVVAGDGGFQLNIQELQTIKRLGLPIKMVVMNNECHGMVRQFQESYFKGRYHSTVWGYSAPAFAQIASAYGLDSMVVNQPDEIDGSLVRMWTEPNQPFLLEVKIGQLVNAYPKMAFGRPISEMEPFARPTEMEGT